MIPQHFISAFANHLWQSTIVAAVAGLLAFALRHNHARTRYWLWLIASVKFLVPFSVLTAVGSRFGSPFASLFASLAGAPVSSRLAPHELSIVMEQIGRPFATPAASAAILPAALAQPAGLMLSTVLAGIWALGFMTVTFFWFLRWRRIRLAVRASAPLRLADGVPVLSSPAMLEPGVFGIFRPVMLLPAGITDQLSTAHLEAILAHELCHIRRRDNLAAALHMAVQAIFWFHPLLWWIGTRLVAERENACDEEVLRRGSHAQVYAESILKTCQFYLESPVICMSGIAGADLTKRITRIMSHHVVHKLSMGRKLLLAAAGAAALAGPVLFGLLNAPPSRAQSPAAATPPPAFEVVSIKPDRSGDGRVMVNINPSGRFVAQNVTVKFLLQEAYRVKDSQISGVPGWLDAEHYDVEAKPEDALVEAQRKLSEEERHTQLMLMLQSMLADRFKLSLHHETKEMPIYALMVAKNGPKLHESPPSADDDGPPGPLKPDGPQPRHSIRMMGRGDLSVNGESLDMFADVLSRQIGRLVVNKTGLKGNFDFALKWTPDEGQGRMFKGGDGPPRDAPPPDASGPSIFAALQEQLGLKLDSQKGPVDVIVIDRVEKPSEN